MRSILSKIHAIYQAFFPVLLVPGRAWYKEANKKGPGCVDSQAMGRTAGKSFNYVVICSVLHASSKKRVSPSRYFIKITQETVGKSHRDLACLERVRGEESPR
ncbi:hypothetical protein KI387_013839, partial [Taxus chinensis]